jgi:hypothetical protein
VIAAPPQPPEHQRHELLAGYGVLVLVAGVALGVVALVLRGEQDPPFDAVLLATGALAVAFGLQMLHRAVPIAPPLAQRGAAPPADAPQSLHRIENAVSFGCSRAVDAHMLVRPVLREIALQRLSAHGVDLDSDARAQVMLGPWAWGLLRPDLPEPPDWHAPGLDAAALERIVESLEAL